MESVSPALTDAFRLLRTDLLGLLDAAEFFGRMDEWDEPETDLAHRIIDDLVTVIRGMLVGHAATDTGVCRKCGESYPCDLVRTLHALIKDPDREFVRILHATWEVTPG
ncbi:MAG TPA: hypothetical protein VG756_24085 [Pseudonocardiaceae bacterium]|jgi:hypothetical protein|nr:hypothetical protein [Pseudonocardiaceae bacterium]